MKTIAILADRPTAATGFAVVCNNLALLLSKMSNVRIIYFARFGLWRCKDCNKKFSFMENPLCPFCKSPNVETVGVGIGHDLVSVYQREFEYIPTEGGVWREEIVNEIIKTYKPDIVFSEDDWWSAHGLISATNKNDVPFYFLSPIDGLPISREAHQLFERCEKVFVPNSSYKLIKNGVFLPHGVNPLMFRPLKKEKMFDKFTFLWNGRDEIRKALGRAILAFKQAYTVGDCQMIVRTSWGMPTARRTMAYLNHHKEIPIIKDRMRNCPHGFLRNIYGNCDTVVITSKGGGFEMQSIEAMACEVPILCTDWTFMNEQIVDGKNGWLIPISGYHMTDLPSIRYWGNISIPKLAEKMRWMITHQDKVKKMGKWARKYVIKNCSWSRIAKSLYSSLELD